MKMLGKILAWLKVATMWDSVPSEEGEAPVWSALRRRLRRHRFQFYAYGILQCRHCERTWDALQECDEHTKPFRRGMECPSCHEMTGYGLNRLPPEPTSVVEP